ncbi:hypothetical protein L1887_01716 [Cichorium endivia]|nr:hypothetical protein L1887_01716 [Cichorium endivia]
MIEFHRLWCPGTTSSVDGFIVYMNVNSSSDLLELDPVAIPASCVFFVVNGRSRNLIVREVRKNLRHIQGPRFIIVVEPLKSHDAVPVLGLRSRNNCTDVGFLLKLAHAFDHHGAVAFDFDCRRKFCIFRGLSKRKEVGLRWSAHHFPLTIDSIWTVASFIGEKKVVADYESFASAYSKMGTHEVFLLY